MEIWEYEKNKKNKNKITDGHSCRNTAASKVEMFLNLSSTTAYLLHSPVMNLSLVFPHATYLIDNVAFYALCSAGICHPASISGLKITLASRNYGALVPYKQRVAKANTRFAY